MSEPLRVLLAGNPDAVELLKAAARAHRCELIVERDQGQEDWDLIVGTPDALDDLVRRFPGIPIVVPRVSDETVSIAAIELGAYPIPDSGPHLAAATLRRALR